MPWGSSASGGRGSLALYMTMGLLVSGCHPQVARKPVTVEEVIRKESLKPSLGKEGHPLPLASQWMTGSYAHTHPGAGAQPDPAWQMAQIAKGHYFLPVFPMPRPAEFEGYDSRTVPGEEYEAYLLAPFREAASKKLPVTLVSTQWERYLSDHPPYSKLPPKKNPNVVTPDGKVLDKVDPFGPTELWYEVGRRLTGHAGMKQLQEIYPNPPKVVFLSNNEHRKLNWKDVEQSQRYLEKYGANRDDAFKRKVVGDAWVEKYRALQNGLRDGLVNETWKKNAIFIGYGGDRGIELLGRWPEWVKHSLYSPGRFSLAAQTWDGISPSYYMHNWNELTDYTVMSTQIESMNQMITLQEGYRINQAFWFELSIWDGDEANPHTGRPSKIETYRTAGQVYDSLRHQGWMQYGMWLLKPRVMRFFRTWRMTLADYGERLEDMMAVVDRVHNSETLKEYWVHGEPVPNPKGEHPYRFALPEGIEAFKRWFLLDVDINPKPPFKLDTEIPVYALALKRGEAPNRSWLLYVFAPLRDYTNVEVTIPDGKPVRVDVPRGGTFYEIQESDAQARRVKL